MVLLHDQIFFEVRAMDRQQQEDDQNHIKVSATYPVKGGG